MKNRVEKLEAEKPDIYVTWPQISKSYYTVEGTEFTYSNLYRLRIGYKISLVHSWTFIGQSSISRVFTCRLLLSLRSCPPHQFVVNWENNLLLTHFHFISKLTDRYKANQNWTTIMSPQLQHKYLLRRCIFGRSVGLSLFWFLRKTLESLLRWQMWMNVKTLMSSH